MPTLKEMRLIKEKLESFLLYFIRVHQLYTFFIISGIITSVQFDFLYQLG